jgi:hypothetical protein
MSASTPSLIVLGAKNHAGGKGNEIYYHLRADLPCNIPAQLPSPGNSCWRDAWCVLK